MDSAHSLDHIVRLTSQTNSFKEVAARLANGQQQVLFHGLPTTLAAFLASHIRTALERPVLIVAADEDRAEQWRDDLQVIAGEQMVYYFPAWDVGIYDPAVPGPRNYQLARSGRRAARARRTGHRRRPRPRLCSIR